MFTHFTKSHPIKNFILCLLFLTTAAVAADPPSAERVPILIRLVEVQRSPLRSSFLIGRFVPIQLHEGGGAGKPPQEKILGPEFLVKFSRNPDPHEQSIGNVMTSCQEPSRLEKMKLTLILSVPADVPKIKFDAHAEVPRNFGQWVIRKFEISQ